MTTEQNNKQRRNRHRLSASVSPAYDDGEPLAVGDVLVLGDEYSPGLMKQPLVVPVAVKPSKPLCDSVVLPRKYRVEGSQHGVLRASRVA